MSSTADTNSSQFLEEYKLTLWYVPGLRNPAADTCSRLTSQQLMDIENATRTRAFVIPLVENWASREKKPVDEFLHVLKTHSLTTRCGLSRTTTCTFGFQVDAPWGRILTLMNLRNQLPNSTLNPPSNRRTWSRYHQMRRLASRRTWDWS